VGFKNRQRKDQGERPNDCRHAGKKTTPYRLGGLRREKLEEIDGGNPNSGKKNGRSPMDPRAKTYSERPSPGRERRNRKPGERGVRDPWKEGT